MIPYGGAEKAEVHRTSAALRILVIEDSEDDALLMLRALSRAGVRVEWRRVDSAGALAAALRAAPWDLVTCDWVMPGLAAVDAMRLVRDADPTLPIVVVTGEDAAAVTPAALRAGARRCLSKSDLAPLVSLIESLRAGGRAGR